MALQVTEYRVIFAFAGREKRIGELFCQFPRGVDRRPSEAVVHTFMRSCVTVSVSLPYKVHTSLAVLQYQNSWPCQLYLWHITVVTTMKIEEVENWKRGGPGPRFRSNRSLIWL